MKRTFTILVFWILLQSFTLQADLVEPDYEIKLYLSCEKVLQPGKLDLTPEVARFFAMTKKVAMSMQFHDSNSKALYEEGWLVRIRNRQDKKGLEFTYKYRIPVTTSIEDALLKAEELGWDSSETGYDYQIDWGYEKKTLSISKSKEGIDLPDVDEDKLELPKGQSARDACVEFMPGKLAKWGKNHLGIKDWASKILAGSHRYGVVYGDRHIGSWNEVKVYIEVWNVANTPVAEFSFKVKDFEEAQKLQRIAKELLQSKGWLIEKDILKTRMILDNY